MSEKLNRFVNLLRSIFELDKSDLDFGIYRIMNIRKDQIDEFLSKKLPEEVKSILKIVADDKETLLEKINELKAHAQRFKFDLETNGEYVILKEQLMRCDDLASLENDVYSYLYNFFNRYYDEGDFISKRRYKEGVYAIPYEGEEVKMYWANQDQYYIKTTENFKDYSFISNGITVHFMLIDATTEQNNNKENGKKRAFMLFNENDEQPGIKTFELKGNEFIIRFIYDLSDDKQTALNEKNYKAIKEFVINGNDKLIPLITPSITFNKENISPIQKHLISYVAKNTFDYFIHKDLGVFLNRELDFFVKNEIFHLDDIDTKDEEHVSKYLARVRAVKKVGKIIIDFLAQIENFQKKLWLKKKFVVRTNWCITLDRVPETLYEEIRKNKAQIKEWIELYAIDSVVNGDCDLELKTAWSNPPNVEFLKANKNLIIDTKHFTEMFRDTLISSIDNLDEETDGLLIHSENFQALKLLLNKYISKIDCIYIDPPYNAKSSEILYKNNYKHSSWLSLIHDRLLLSKYYLNSSTVSIIAVDEVENFYLGLLLSHIYPNYEDSCISIQHNPTGQQGDNFSFTHDFAHFVFPRNKSCIGLENRNEANRDSEPDIRPFRNVSSGKNHYRDSAANCFYPIYVKNGTIIGFGDVPVNSFHPKGINEKLENDIIAIYPIDSNNDESKWVFARETVETIFNELKAIFDPKKNIWDIERTKSKLRYKSLWSERRYSANSWGSVILNNMFKELAFEYPKSIYTVMDCIDAGMNNKTSGIVLDYFAGSGTTGHAVINLNRNDNGNRKYILVEMGEYFNSVTKPRMQKVIYSKDWKDGKPLSRSTGISHIMKYMQLESYEDTLSNVEFSDNPKGKSFAFGNEYLLNYMLDVETKGSLLNIDKFNEPFFYKIYITNKNETVENFIDLIETFNYLIGLNVVRQGIIRYFDTLTTSKEYAGSVELKEDNNGLYSFKQIIGRLSDDRRVLIIWRNITEDINESNAALDAYFYKNRINADDRNFDLIYVNGDNNLENLRTDNENWKVSIIEKEFLNKMFEE